MQVAVYGHYGFALMMIPTAASDYLEYERNGIIDSLEKYIYEGKVKVYCINSINDESWLNPHMHGYDQAMRHQAYNDYIIKEVVPFIKDTTSSKTDIIACGISFGALHAANQFFKHPEIFQGLIGISGCYDLSAYSNGYFDNNVYFNSPVHYLPQLKVESHLAMYRQSRHIHFITGQGAYEVPDYSRHISSILNSKDVPHELDIWGYDIPHDWWAWRKMLPYYIESRF